MMNSYKHDLRKMLMSFDNFVLVNTKKKDMGDHMKALDGPDTICLCISSKSLHYKHFKQNNELISCIYARMTPKTS